MPSVATAQSVTKPFTAKLSWDDDPIQGEYYPYKTTPNDLAQIEEALQKRDAGVLATQIAQTVAAWNLRWKPDDKEPIPLQEEALRGVPIDILVAVTEALQGENSVPKPTTTPSVL